MDDSVVLARLTLMLLRASVSDPESLKPNYGVIIMPTRSVLSQEKALAELADLRGPLAFRAEARDGNLVIYPRQPTPDDEDEIHLMAETLFQVLRDLDPSGDPEALVHAVGFGESLSVPVKTVQQWLRLALCPECSLGLSEPGGADPVDVVAVMEFGTTRRR